MAPAVLGVLETIVAFRMKWPEDTERVVRVVCTGDLKFVPQEREVERDGGYEWVSVTEKSYSVNVSEKSEESVSQQQSETTTQSTAIQQTESHGSGLTKCSQVAQGDVDTRSRALEFSSKRPEQISHADSSTIANGSASSNTVTKSNGQTSTNSQASANSHGSSSSHGTAHGMGMSISEKQIPLHQVVVKKELTGQLEESIADQIERSANSSQRKSSGSQR